MSSGRSVVVVGAGLGGLSAAISLASRGYKVQVFEKNARIGGKLNLLEKDGFRFDLGPSILILPQIFERLFTQSGRRMADYVDFVPLDPQWRSFWEDGTQVDLWGDTAKMHEELARIGADRDAWDRYVAYSRDIWEFAEKHYLESGADRPDLVAGGASWRTALKRIDVFRTMQGAIDDQVSEPHLRDMLGFFSKYVGSSALDSPALMNLLPHSQLAFGLFYVPGGLYNLARGIETLLGELGVEVHLNAPVKRIVQEGRVAKGLELADGRVFDADVVVSNMEVIPAHEQLLGEKNSLLMSRYRAMFEPAASGLVVHLGVKGEFPQLKHHNFFFSGDHRAFLDQIHRKKQLPDDPTIYLVSPTVTDKTLAPPGHSIIKLLPHVPYIQDKPFTREDYVALKERCFTKLERMGLKGLRDSIVLEDMLTPDDLQRMYGSNRGAIYGVVSSWKRNFAFKAPKKSEKYDNLWFVGGSVNPGGGTPMVVMSGQLVARRIADEDAARATQAA